MSLSSQSSVPTSERTVEDDLALIGTPEEWRGDDAADAADAADGTAGADDAGPATPRRPWARRPELRTAAWWATTGLAGVVVFCALVVPNRLDRITPGNFVALPLEGLVAVALVLLLPPRARRVLAGLFGAGLGLLIDP